MNEKLEMLSLRRQMQGLKNENERLSSQLHNVKLLNTKWKKYDDEREEYVVTLTAAYHKAKSEVTVLNSFLRDTTNDLKTAEKKIADLEKLRDKEIELINADLTIEKQKGVIVQLEDQLSQLQQEFSQSKIQFKEQVLQVTIDFKNERKERMEIGARYDQLQREFVTFRASSEKEKMKAFGFRDTNDNDFPLDNRSVIESKYSTSNLEETNINRPIIDNRSECDINRPIDNV